ncbi:carboxylate-amine ligase, YbdK family [Mycolicibacterium tokaiense]|uniref:Carboxylate-amine ligase, YbdK family n=2 Tax=Mycolicibacterium tokaiense TaxID=39695 RepID=A0A378TLL0_9MYCO|nr:carboxylate-amine ligase, YbdK family [Mycolicibacterium tokaiense]
MRTTEGERQVDVIYRRIDDEFLDPMHFKPDSVLGVAGVLNAARAGNVVISSAVGNGVGDDKLVYTYVPTMVEYYLGEKPALANVDTFRCWLDDEREEVLDRIDELVIKPVEGSGGYGIVFGPDASEKELAAISKKVRADPRGWIAQPVVQLSTVPTQIDDRLSPRHVDLRPFAVNDGDDVWVLPGGLTRVALPEGSLVVNSSQGGGSKDTWVLASRTSVADRELGAAEVVRALPKAPKSAADRNGDGASSSQQQQQQAGVLSQQQGPQSQQQQQQQQAVMH